MIPQGCDENFLRFAIIGGIIPENLYDSTDLVRRKCIACKQKNNAMLVYIHGAKCMGIKAVEVVAEVEISLGIGIHLVGLADVAVKESLLRTVTALQAMGFHIPGKKIIINLAPADMHKQGSGYDLAIALGIIAASQQRPLPGLEK